MPPPVEAAAGYAVEKGQRKTNASEGAKMKQHITHKQAQEIYHSVTRAGKGYATTQEILNAAIQHYIDRRKEELQALPDAKHAKEWQHDMYTADQLQAYGAACAAHAREVALAEAETKYSSLVMVVDEAMRNGILDIGIEEAIEQLKALKKEGK